MTTRDEGKLFILFVPLFTLPNQQDILLPSPCDDVINFSDLLHHKIVEKFRQELHI